MRLAYSFFLSLVLLAALPLLPLLLLWPKARKGLLQRFGILPFEVKRMALVGKGSLWVHAASLGEVNAVAPVLAILQGRMPETPLLFTCTTEAGLDQARKLFPGAVAHLFLPIDLPFLLLPYFRKFKPLHAVIAETELWPNFISMLKARRAQLVLANARLTDKSLGRYLMLKPLFAPALQEFDAISAQSEDDAKRYLELGAKASRVLVTGNTKFDVAAMAREARKKGEQLREALKLAPGQPLLVAASTRPGDEELFLNAFAQLGGIAKGFKLLIAPRHLDRLSEVLAVLASGGSKASLRTHGPAETDFIVLDTLGELPAALSLASLAWIGGSFSGFGGQNPIEAAALGVPLVFGPDMRHFKDPARVLVSSGAALQVEPRQLAAVTADLLKDEAARRRMGAAGLEAVKASSGASLSTADLVWKLVVTRRLREDEHDWRERSAFSSHKVLEFGSLASQIKDPAQMPPVEGVEETYLVREKDA